MNRLYSRRDVLKLGGYAMALMLGYPVLKVGGKDLYQQYLDSFPRDPNNPIDTTKHFFRYTEVYELFESCDGFERREISLDEPMELPDDITERLLNKARREGKYGIRFGKIPVDPNSLAIHTAAASEETLAVPPYLAVKRYKNNKNLELVALYNFQILREDDKYAKEIEDHVKWLDYPDFFKGIDKEIYRDLELNRGFPDCAINLYDWVYADNPDKLDSRQRIWYDRNPDGWDFVPGVLIHYKDCLVKTPREVFEKAGLAEIDFEIPSTPPPAETKQTPTGKEVGEKPAKVEKSPGFGVIGTGAAGLAAYGIKKWREKI